MAQWLWRSVSNLQRLLAWVRIPRSQSLTTSQQPTQLSIPPRSINEYSKVTLRARALIPQAYISCIAAHIPACIDKKINKKQRCLIYALLCPLPSPTFSKICPTNHWPVEFVYLLPVFMLPINAMSDVSQQMT